MSRTPPKAIIYASPALSCYVGRLEANLRRSNISPTLLISLEDELEVLNLAGTPIMTSQSLLLPAGAEININTHGAVLMQCFLDDTGITHQRLAQQMLSRNHIDTHIIHSGLPIWRNLALAAESIVSNRPQADDAFAQLSPWISAPQELDITTADSRIVTVMQLIKDNHSENTSVEQLAKAVNLSVPRLVQLFKLTTGTPIRRFRLWHRIFATARNLTTGQTLTEAAISAGFSDYAQFSRVYRELCGASPAAAKKNTDIRVLEDITS